MISSPRAYKSLPWCAVIVRSLFNSSDVLLLLRMKETGINDRYLVGVYIFYNAVYAALPTRPVFADRIGWKNIHGWSFFICHCLCRYGPRRRYLFICVLVLLYGICRRDWRRFKSMDQQSGGKGKHSGCHRHPQRFPKYCIVGRVRLQVFSGFMPVLLLLSLSSALVTLL